MIYVLLTGFAPDGYILFIITIFKDLFIIYLFLSTCVCELCTFLAPKEALELEL